MEGTWKIVAAIIALTGFSWTIYSASTAFFKLEKRIDVLEDQVKLFVTAPIISRQPGGGYSVPAPESDKTVPNPVIALCIDLTNKAADARRRNASISEPIALDGFIKDYGCADALKAAGKR